MKDYPACKELKTFFVLLQGPNGKRCLTQRNNPTTKNSHVSVNYTWKNTQTTDTGEPHFQQFKPLLIITPFDAFEISCI